VDRLDCARYRQVALQVRWKSMYRRMTSTGVMPGTISY